MARRTIHRMTPEAAAATMATATLAPVQAPVELPPLLPPLTGAVMCCWCWHEQSGIRGLPAGVESRTCARHIRALFEAIASRRGETLVDVLERAERVAQKARVPAPIRLALAGDGC